MDGLELDRRNLKYVYNHQPSDAQASQVQLASEPSLPSKRICTLRPVTLVLSAALAVVAVLAVVAAAVGGSLATKREHCYTNLVAESTSSSIPISTSSSSTPNSTTTNCTSPATNSTASLLPTSDCDKLDNNYISTIGRHTEFNVFCESDLIGDIYLGVFVYYFEDCIESCASFNDYQTNEGSNLTCYGVAFALDWHKDPQNLRGNCLLKSAHSMSPTYRAYTSAASLIRS